MTRPNTIRLKGCGRQDERRAYAALKPGHFLELVNDAGTLKVQKNVSGGELMIAIEDSLQGKTIIDAYASGDIVFHRFPERGDEVLGRVPAGAPAIAVGARLTGDGAGCVRAGGAAGGNLYNSIASSAAIGASSNAEADFATLQYTNPAGFLKAGDKLHVRGWGRTPTTHTTDTFTPKVYFGGTLIATGPSVDVADNDAFTFDLELVCRVAGASGKLVVGGQIGVKTTQNEVAKAEFTQDLSVTNLIKASGTFSVADAGNTAVLDALIVDIERGPNSAPMTREFVALEAVDNSAGVSETFIRLLVP